MNHELRIKRGFTLIEVMVVVAIIGLLVTLGIVSYAPVNKRSRDAKRKGDVEQLRSALELYRADNGYYPDTGTGNWTDAAGLATYLVATYIPLIPTDPKTGQVYRYKVTTPSGSPVRYYGYCVSAYLESENPSDSCTPDSGSLHNYGAKNP